MSFHKKELSRILSAVLALVLILSAFTGCGKKNENAETAAPSEATEPATAAATPSETLDPSTDYEGLKTLSAYTVNDLTADDPRLDKVVAECCGEKLTNRQLQIYFYMQLFSYASEVSQYGITLDQIGIDLDSPLSEQDSKEMSGLTLEQFFLKSALDQFHQSAAIKADADEANYVMDEEVKAQLKTMVDGLEEEAKNRGYDSLDAFLEDSFGVGVKKADYTAYTDYYYYVMSYESELYNKLECSDEDLLEYFNTHAENYSGVTMDQMLINVRHILVMPKDADGDKKSTEAEWAEAKAEAESLYAEYQEDPTEEHFAALAKEHSEDRGSAANGGLYEDVYPGQMVQTFNDWCFDAERKPGDTGIVETTYGYHVMYFVENTGEYYWKTLAKKDYASTRMNTLLQEIVDRADMTVDYASIVLNPTPKSLVPADA